MWYQSLQTTCSLYHFQKRIKEKTQQGCYSLNKQSFHYLMDPVKRSKMTDEANVKNCWYCIKHQTFCQSGLREGTEEKTPPRVSYTKSYTYGKFLDFLLLIEFRI